MADPEFVYVTYILATSEPVRLATRFAVGSSALGRAANAAACREGHREHSATAARTDVGCSGRRIARGKTLQSDVRNRSVGDVVRLRVTHEPLEADSDMLHRIREGWPKVLSSLKSLLERGQPLPSLW